MGISIRKFGLKLSQLIEITKHRTIMVNKLETPISCKQGNLIQNFSIAFESALNIINENGMN